MEKSYNKLLENNKNWVAAQLAVDPVYFDKLANSQNGNDQPFQHKQ